ncbi:hypothetical protein ATCC90586_005621 [Pythium insidiosum]|nr:hypothetical protein ATCC90586_005621 [Pythium insidiosum]
MAASLDKEQWLFYAAEGSNSIKVTAIDSREPPKKISRKAANRSSQITFLAYHSARRLLCAGGSDGSLQIWSFSEENALGGKEEAAIVAPVFATPTNPAPVVHVAFQQSGAAGCFLSVGYQSRVLEIWDFMALTGGSARQREPFRVTTLHASCVAVAELAVGGGDAVTLSNWLELFAGRDSSDDSSHAALLLWPTVDRAYLSASSHRQLTPLRVEGSSAARCISLDNARLSLSSAVQLSLDQYYRYSDVSATLLQVTRSSVESSPSAANALAFQLQVYSLQTAETTKLGDLPMWNNYQGRQLLPWRVLCNDVQSAVCLQLHDPARLSSSSALGDADSTVSYVVIEVSSTGGPRRDDADGDDTASATSRRMKSGAIMDAMDVCFAPSRAEDKESATRAYTLLVLASTGKSLCVQTTSDHVDDSSRVLLSREAQRIFVTPLPTRSTSALAAAVGVRVLYKLKPSSVDAVETLVLSEDDLSMPPLGSGSTWATRHPSERLVDVLWNAGGTDPDQAVLAAVWTTQRLVILSGQSLAVVATYELEGELAAPESVLWVAQTLLVATGDDRIRCLAPLRPAQSSTVLASLPMRKDRTQRVQLLCACGDRLGLAVSDIRTLETRTSLRPVAVCEPLFMGFNRPNDRLRAILERDVLVFAGSGGLEPRCPISSDALLRLLYDEFAWTETTVKALDVLLSSGSGASGAAGSGGGVGSGAISSFRKTSHLSPQALASVYLSSQRWRDALRALLTSDPGLEEYVLADDDTGGSSAKLPSRSGAMARQLRRLASVFSSLGQLDLALKCLDTAGDDLGILSLGHDVGVGTAEPLLALLQKDWARLNPPLASLTTAVQRSQSPSTSAVWRRHDLFSLLCCAQLGQPERRSRLLTSVRPMDRLTLSLQRHESQEPSSTLAERASVLYWRRLAPEDTKDIVGLATSPHIASDEPKNPMSYGAFSSASGLATSAVGLSGSTALGGSTLNSSNTTNSSDSSNDKQTIGPFLEDEDAVVAYWRFEEGTTANEDDTPRTLESMDTSKRENHLQIPLFQSLLRLAASTAPVDRGEEGKLQEEFALRFPRADVDVSSSSVDEWSARCGVRPGSTLDIGFVFDEDPYRRKLTVELWVRDVALFTMRQQEEQAADPDDDDGSMRVSRGSSSMVTASQQPCSLVSRRGADGSIWWELGLDSTGRLVLRFNAHLVVAEEPVPSLATWQHVAFSIDITSPKQAMLKLFVQARCVASKDVGGVDANAKLVKLSRPSDDATGASVPPSSLHLGYKLQDLEVTEVRVWATARTVEQLSDMKENYLGIAEAKRRMKIAIHNRNCQCDKCLGRRTKTPTGKVSLLSSPFPSTPPSAGSSRDRRRPQPKTTG